jgi:hypothetical protein
MSTQVLKPTDDPSALLRRLASAALNINSYAGHDDDCGDRWAASCGCGYTAAANVILDTVDEALKTLGPAAASPARKTVKGPGKPTNLSLKP